MGCHGNPVPERIKRILALQGCGFIPLLLSEQNLQGTGVGVGGSWGEGGVGGEGELGGRGSWGGGGRSWSEKHRGFWDAGTRVGNRAVVQGFRTPLGQLMFFFESHLKFE